MHLILQLMSRNYPSCNPAREFGFLRQNITLNEGFLSVQCVGTNPNARPCGETAVSARGENLTHHAVEV